MGERRYLPPDQRQTDSTRRCRRDHVGHYVQNTYGAWKCTQCVRDQGHAADVRNGRITPDGAGSQRGRPRTRQCDAAEIRCMDCKVVHPRDAYPPSRLAKNSPCCRACCSVRAKAWKAANPDKVISYMVGWREANAEHLVEHARRRYETDPEGQRARSAAYRATEDGRRKRALLQQNRNARAKGVTNTLTDAEWKWLVAYYDHRCVCCGQRRPLARDHIVPLSEGAPLTFQNCQPLCRPCNSRKRAKTIDYRFTVMPDPPDVGPAPGSFGLISGTAS